MDFIVLLIRIILAAVFLVAAIGKWRDSSGTRQAVSDFGAPGTLAPTVAFALPFLELAAVLLLLVGVSAFYGAILALALLAAFSAGMVYNLAQGRAPDCHCFGQLHSEPVGWQALARNAVLGLGTVLVIAQGTVNRDSQAVQWLRDLSIAQRMELGIGVAIFLVLAAQLWALLQVIDQNRLILARLESAGGPSEAHSHTHTETAPARPEGLPPGTAAPAFALPDLDGTTITLEDLLVPAKALFLLFVDPQCAPCNALLPEVARWQGDHMDQVRVVLISRRDAAANEAKRREHGLQTVLLQQDYEIIDSYLIPGTPGAVLVRPDGTIGSPATAGADGVRWLLDRVLTLLRPSLVPSHLLPDGPGPEDGASPTLASGLPAPSLHLPERSGRLVDLKDFLGSRTLLLFWNTSCGFCRHMLPDLEDWEASPPTDAPFLVLISAGTEEEIRAIPLNSPVLVDPLWAGAEAFGVDGTPTGVMLNADGTIGERATGASHIFGLLGTPGRVRTRDAS